APNVCQFGLPNGVKDVTRWSPPEHLARTITQMVQDLGGNPKYLQSDITRLSKMYWACTQIFTGFTNVWFLEQLTAAYVKTCKARKVSKRVPYFFKTLEGILELTSEELAYIRSQEALYRDGDLKTFLLGLEQSYHRSGSPLEYQEEVPLRSVRNCAVKQFVILPELGGVLKRSPSKVVALDDVHENSAKVIRCTATNRPLAAISISRSASFWPESWRF
ncbi:MAG TPA: hypothetical protein VKU38_23200, partial [Ktedonobacteraceae bacterium]|nr:hypothetical protein [Ktedonobacteraceae bacterium]